METEAFSRIGYAIGGMMVFPCYRVDRKMTINQARGCHGWIRDRFDLTLECIRWRCTYRLNVRRSRLGQGICAGLGGVPNVRICSRRCAGSRRLYFVYVLIQRSLNVDGDPSRSVLASSTRSAVHAATR